MEGMLIVTNKKLENYLYGLGITPVKHDKSEDFLARWYFEKNERLDKALNFFRDFTASATKA